MFETSPDLDLNIALTPRDLYRSRVVLMGLMGWGEKGERKERKQKTKKHDEKKEKTQREKKIKKKENKTKEKKKGMRTFGASLNNKVNPINKFILFQTMRN